MMASNMILMGEKNVLNKESVTQTAFSSMGFSAVVMGRGMRTVGTFSVNRKNGWFIRENPIEMDDKWGYPHDFGTHLSHRNRKITPLDDGTNRIWPSRSSSQFLREQRDELPHRDPRMVGGSV